MKKSVNDKRELKEIISKLAENIDCLEEILNRHKASIDEKNKKIALNFPKIKAQFSQPEVFDSLIKKIALLYENPEINMLHGEDIRSTLQLLANQQNLSHSDELKKNIEQIEEDLFYSKQRVKSFALLDKRRNEENKNEWIKCYNSLMHLLKMCHAVEFSKMKKVS